MKASKHWYFRCHFRKKRSTGSRERLERKTKEMRNCNKLKLLWERFVCNHGYGVTEIEALSGL